MVAAGDDDPDFHDDHAQDRGQHPRPWPKLLDGVAVEAFIESDPGRAFDPVGAEAVRAFLAEGEGGALGSEAVTERTYVQVRRTERVLLVESCDRSRGNLVLRRSFLAR